MSDAHAQSRAKLIVPVCQQILLSLLSFSVMDFGLVALAGHCASGAFWAGVLVICLRRSADALPRTDRFYLGYGLLIAWLVGVPLFHLVWAWKKIL
jgi:hypothetical protein